MKGIINKTVRIAIVILLSNLISKGIRVGASIFQGQKGAPSFVTPSFTAFGILTELLIIGAYILIGYQIPVKNKILKGLIFILLFWSSDYMSQILGMTGGKSAVMSKDAVSIITILSDSAGYFVKGILMGALLTFKEPDKERQCPKRKFISSCLVSMAVYTGLLFILEIIIGLINPDFTCASAFVIDKNDILSFYIVFYVFQALSGLLFPVFYRYTEYSSSHERRWLRFADIYGLMLWTPIVLIVIFFGVAVPVTIVFAVIMLISIYVDTYIFAKIMG